MSNEAEAWYRGLAAALTGQELEFLVRVGGAGAARGVAGSVGTAAGMLAALADAGWDRAAIATVAQAAAAAGRPWPTFDPALAARFGAARLQAALTELQQLLELDVSYQPPSHRTTLTADERRLLADVPPHHGTV